MGLLKDAGHVGNMAKSGKFSLGKFRHDKREDIKSQSTKWSRIPQ